MEPKVTVCTITYNCMAYLPRLLESLKNSSFKGMSLLFVDNGSSDETVRYLEGYDIEKSIIRLNQNRGHSYAANVALRECKTGYLVLLDHDTVVDKDLFKNLYIEAEKYKDSDYAVFAPIVLDRGRNETYYGDELHFIGKPHANREMPRSPEVGMIASTAPLLDMNKLRTGLEFDEDFFIYYNDTDFFYRLRAYGKKIRLVAGAFVEHFGGTKDYSHRGGENYSALRAFYLTRNHRLFIIKNYSCKSIFLLSPCFLMYELFNIGFCIRKRIFIKGYLGSLISTLRLMPKMISKRADFQKNRRLGERVLVGWHKLDHNPGVINTGFEYTLISVFDGILRVYFSLIKPIL